MFSLEFSEIFKKTVNSKQLQTNGSDNDTFCTCVNDSSKTHSELPNQKLWLKLITNESTWQVKLNDGVTFIFAKVSKIGFSSGKYTLAMWSFLLTSPFSINSQGALIRLGRIARPIPIGRVKPLSTSVLAIFWCLHVWWCQNWFI